MAEPYFFEGPFQTVFVIEPRVLRIFTSDGREALVEAEDLIAFLVHLSVHQAAALSLLTDFPYRRLAVALRRWIHHEHG